MKEEKSSGLPYYDNCLLCRKSVRGTIYDRRGRSCKGIGCETCGWDRDEAARRLKLLDNGAGLVIDHKTGLRHLVVAKRRQTR